MAEKPPHQQHVQQGVPEEIRLSGEMESPGQGSPPTGLFQRALLRLSTFMVRYPYINIIVVLFAFIWMSVFAFVPSFGAQDLPDFSKATKGFEPRDTKISNREAAINNLESFYRSGSLSTQPYPNPVRRKRAIQISSNCLRWTFGSYVAENKIIYKHKSGGNLLKANRLKEMCQLQEKVMRKNSMFDFSVNKDSTNKACPSFSIATYILFHNNKQVCSSLTDSDVTNFKNVLKQCVAAYKDGSLKACIDRSSLCSTLTSPCNTWETAKVVYNTFHYLTDTDFAKDPDVLKYALISESLNAGSVFYESIYNSQLKDLSEAVDGSVQVAAFEFWNLKFNTFNTQLIQEGALLFVAIIIVILFIMIYSGSIFIGLMTFLCILIAAAMAYFFYGVVFRLSFFPFLNVLTFVFLVGIGADDAFVFMGAWKEAKRLMPRTRDKTFEQSLIEWTVYSIKHATVAMLVTSMTTASAFYANATSKIIAVRCFAVYAGTCILLNYLLMVVWFPVAVIISEKYFSPCMARCMPKCCPDKASVVQPSEEERKFSGGSRGLWSKVDHISRGFFEDLLPRAIKNLRFVFIFVFLGLGIGGLVVLFVSPKLQLPISSDFMMFAETHPLEQYPLFYKSKFAFGQKGSSWYMPLQFVFGVKSENTASMMNPDDKGKLQLKPSFSISGKAEQIWLKSFCDDLKKADFIEKNFQGTCYNFKLFWDKLEQNCTTSDITKTCCGRKIPISPADFDNCAANFSKQNSLSSMNSLLYDKSNKQRALVLGETSKFFYTESYQESDKIFKQVESWMESKLKNAPTNFADGWWHTSLSFYDLQNGLATGTQVSLGVSVAIAFAVVLLTTWNVLISVYSVICIICVISVSVGILVLAGWRLNILESIIFSVAAGLSVDFTLHYGVAYRTAVDKGSRESRVRYSLIHLGSAVSLGAITTFISGLVMAPATVLVYIQLSHFLMTLMTFSWLYATFFFLSLCSAIGPTNNFCQLSIGSLLSCFKQNNTEERVGAGENAGFENHEMAKIST